MSTTDIRPLSIDEISMVRELCRAAVFFELNRVVSLVQQVDSLPDGGLNMYLNIVMLGQVASLEKFGETPSAAQVDTFVSALHPSATRILPIEYSDFRNYVFARLGWRSQAVGDQATIFAAVDLLALVADADDDALWQQIASTVQQSIQHATQSTEFVEPVQVRRASGEI